MRLSLINIGCRLNYAEIDYLAFYFQKMGYEIRDRGEGEAVVLINTCAVTKEAERKSLSLIRRYGKNYPVIVAGCLTELLPEKLKKLPGVFRIIRPTEKERIIQNIFPRPSRHRALIKIQDGCNSSCTFCIVPQIRGREIRSKDEEIVIDEINKMTEMGFSEIVLTGLNLGLYGRERDSSLALLLQKIFDRVKQPAGGFRIRLSSLEPDLIDEDLIKTCANFSVCRHFHLSIQSFDRDCLLKMGRGYSPEAIKEKVSLILSYIPAASIGCDIITGFCGETEAAFERTRRALEEIPFGYFHIFPYSPRPGTPAFHFPDTVPIPEKKRRVKILRELGRIKAETYRRRFLGEELAAVRERDGLAITDNYLRVRVLNPPLPQGLFSVRIEKVLDGTVSGQIVDKTRRENISKLRRVYEL